MYYILITTDKECLSGAKLSAYEVIQKRLKHGKWPLYKGTNFAESINENSKCLIYIGGKKKFAQHIVASININKIKRLKNNYDYEEDLINIISEPAIKVMEFKPTNVEENKAFHLKKELNNLDFIPNGMKKWGVLLMGGVKKITKKDFEYISKKIL